MLVPPVVNAESPVQMSRRGARCVGHPRLNLNQDRVSHPQAEEDAARVQEEEHLAQC